MKRLFQHLINSRQRSADFKIASMLKHSEYKNETVEYVMDMINSGQHNA